MVTQRTIRVGDQGWIIKRLAKGVRIDMHPQGIVPFKRRTRPSWEDVNSLIEALSALRTAAVKEARDWTKPGCTCPRCDGLGWVFDEMVTSEREG